MLPRPPIDTQHNLELGFPSLTNMPKHSCPHIYPPRKRIHIHKTNILDLPDDLLLSLISLLQTPRRTLSGRDVTHPPPAFALSGTCHTFLRLFQSVPMSSSFTLDVVPQNRFHALYHHPQASSPESLAKLIMGYAIWLKGLILPRYHHGVDVSPAVRAAAKECRSLETLSFSDDSCVRLPDANDLLSNNLNIRKIAVFYPGREFLTALTRFRGIIRHLALHALKAPVLPYVKTVLQEQGHSIRHLVLEFDYADFMKTISTRWKYEPLRPFHEALNYIKTNAEELLPELEKIAINLGGRSHFANGLELKWFQELSGHCEVEVYSADGALSIPAKSGVQGVHFVKSLNLGTIFTGPGTYRIGCPTRIDLSNQGFIVKYANGAPIIKDRVRSLVKTVVRHSAKVPALLSVHLGIPSLMFMKMVCQTITDMFTLVPDVTELEVSREIVEYAYDHMFKKMFLRLRNITFLYLVGVQGAQGAQGAQECPLVETSGNCSSREKHARFLRWLPRFLKIVSSTCGQLQCILLDDFGDYEGGLKKEVEEALSTVDWLERERKDLDVGSIRGLLEHWMNTEMQKEKRETELLSLSEGS